ncbi:hypothetical protein SteCoe_18556 [Stentor coeruleus]|uniref:3-hydroxyisobutyryl-CoA hydrolase n=1 Tax=Stentor coeruleus TaxID=5963 RepID=A0A1R2BWA0_9CILI|nr:hypothetical protein SteCoe_18556 [Stentor coeruleus]
MEEIEFRDYGGVARVHINRPSALNSINLDMVSKIRSCIQGNRDKEIVMTGEGRAFCAGGDVVAVVSKNIPVIDYFRNEFVLDYEISCIPTPRIAILDGITMGGGVGLSMACSHRVLTNKTLWAMPETIIGFFPDVGASYFLNKLCCRELGLYLGLTGRHLTGVDAFFSGISSIYIPEITENIKNSILNLGQACLASYQITPDSNNSQILRDLPLIQQFFDSNFTLENIFERLASSNDPWCQKTLSTLNEMCPFSLKLTREMFNRGQSLSYFEVLEMDLNLCKKVCQDEPYNFRHGITWRIIEKKKTRPQWQPSTLQEVPEAQIQNYFSDFPLKLILHKL